MCRIKADILAEIEYSLDNYAFFSVYSPEREESLAHINQSILQTSADLGTDSILG